MTCPPKKCVQYDIRIGIRHFVYPWEGKEEGLATNPIAFAAPTKRSPILVGVSASVASEAKIRVKQFRNELLPAGWILDADGLSVKIRATSIGRLGM